MSGVHIFTLAGIPVVIGPWYFLLVAFWCFSGELWAGIIWSLVVTFSILVHEFGHGLMAKWYRLQPRIMLHGLGGLTFHEHAQRNSHEALITAAGPLAGLIVGVFTWMYAASDLSFAESAEAIAVEEMVVSALLQVNIFWSLVNLLPLHPLDGGKLFRLGLVKLLRPAQAERITYGVGLALSGLWIYVGYSLLDSSFMAIIGVFILLDNLRGWQSGGAAVVRRENRYATELHARAVEAFQAQNFGEAARLGQRIRAESNVGEKVLRDTWRILGVSYARLGRFEEGLTYLMRATSDPTVTEAKIECLHQLQRKPELSELLESEDFRQIPSERRHEITQILGHTPGAAASPRTPSSA